MVFYTRRSIRGKLDISYFLNLLLLMDSSSWDSPNNLIVSAFYIWNRYQNRRISKI